VSQATLQTNRQRADLLGDSRSSALRPRTETLLQEQSSIETSLRLADEMLESAQSSRLSLAHQRDLFANVSNRMATMAEKLPLIGSLVGRITGAKRKDALVMACVISSCIILMFLYVVYVKFG
jgi:Golgi SNAP receptor complex protein 1